MPQSIKKQIILIIVSCYVLLLSPLQLRAEIDAPSTNAKRWTILLLIPLTGPVAEWGQAIRKGAEMSIAESDALIDLVVEDTQFIPAKGLDAYENVRRTLRPDAVVVFGSSVSMALAPRVNHDRILTISISTSDDVQKGKTYVFRHMVSTKVVTDALIPEVQRRNLMRIASIATTQDGMLAFQQAFSQRMGEVVFLTFDVPPNERDFNSLIAKIITQGADSVYSTLLPPQNSLFARQARQLGFKGQIFAATQVNSHTELLAGGAAFEQMFFAVDGDTSVSAFEQRFNARFGTLPDSFASNSYDAIQLLQKALSNPNPVRFLENIQEYKGALGTYGSLPDHTFSVPVHLRSIKQGKSVLLNGDFD